LELGGAARLFFLWVLAPACWLSLIVSRVHPPRAKPERDPYSDCAIPKQEDSSMQQLRSVRLAVVLGLVFGPLGMFYSTIPGAIVMLVLSLIIVPMTMGFGLIVTLPACALWAGLSARSHNKKLLAKQVEAELTWVGRYT
jgi:hypothetical protein